MDLDSLKRGLAGRPPDEYAGFPFVLSPPTDIDSVIHDSNVWKLVISRAEPSGTWHETTFGDNELFHIVLSFNDDKDLRYKFDSSSSAVTLKGIAGAVVPHGASYTIRGTNGFVYHFVAKMEKGWVHPLSISSPVGFRIADLSKFLERRRPRPYKILVPSLWKGEALATNGDILVPSDVTPIVTGTQKFGFSIADLNSEQDFHRHSELTEIFIANRKSTLVYRAGADLKTKEIPSESVIVIPPLVPHGIELEGSLAYVLQGSEGRKFSVEHDKYAILKMKN